MTGPHEPETLTDAEREALCDEVARRVMGWETTRIPWAYHGVASVWRTAGGVPVMTRHTWRPDADDAQCMRVLDRMVALGFDYTLGRAGGVGCAEFRREGSPVHRAEDTERRVALLRAALAALEG